MTLPFLTLAITTNPDWISTIMAILALFMTLSSALYSHGYGISKKRLPSALFWWGLWSFGAFACLTVLAADWFSLSVFIELTSVSLFLMVLVSDTETALMYLLTQLAGAGFLLIGVAILLLSTESTALGPVPVRAQPFFLLGLGIKAALPGLHFWLPRTHSKAPTPASALLSGFAVKLGIYGLIRLASPATDGLFLVLGLIMALYGAIQAILQSDAKRLLAYSTFSQLGFVLSAIGSGSENAVVAALFYSVAHGIFKALLFCSAGILEKSYGTRNLAHLGRTLKDSPLATALFFVGALSITGFPGTSGFIAKGLVKEALKAGHHYSAVWILLLAGLGTTLSFCKMAYYGFLRNTFSSSQDEDIPDAPPDIRCLAAMSLLAAATLLLGIVPLASPELGPPHAASWLALKDLLTALAPILAGVTIFSMAPGLFVPSRIDVPDLYDLLLRCARPMVLATEFLQRSHGGSLRRYLIFLLAAALAILAALR